MRSKLAIVDATAGASAHRSLAEILQQQRDLSARRDQIVRERADLFAVHGFAVTTDLSPAVTAAQAYAAQLLGERAPPSLQHAPAESRDARLAIELHGIDIALRVLGQEEQAARYREDEAWVIAHRDLWRALCRDVVLTACRLFSLEEKARRLVDELRSPGVRGLCLAQYVGGSRSCLGVGDPLQDLVAAAIAEDVCSQKEIRAASAEALHND